MAIPISKWHNNLPTKISSIETSIRRLFLGETRSHNIYISEFIGGNFLKEIDGMRYSYDDVRQYRNSGYLTPHLSSKTEFFYEFETYHTHYFKKIADEAKKYLQEYVGVSASASASFDIHAICLSNYEKEVNKEKAEQGFCFFMEKLESLLSEFILNYQNVIDGIQPKFFMKTGIRNFHTNEVLFMVSVSAFLTNEIKITANGSLSFDENYFENKTSETIAKSIPYLTSFNENNTAKKACSIMNMLFKRAGYYGTGLERQHVDVSLFEVLKLVFAEVVNKEENQDALFLIEDENAVITIEQNPNNSLFKDYGKFSLDRILWFGLYSTGVFKFKPENIGDFSGPSNTFATQAFSTIAAARL